MAFFLHDLTVTAVDQNHPAGGEERGSHGSMGWPMVDIPSEKNVR